ncbi:MAG: GNAT family N-acetyltransferase [Candidatus Cloacimonetes bacterium]|jgi:GNAT superfamily N-acetyltransferase|nr:GNAT family N-acetyltransferase [Candidatus Cloacimonadota bacterium]MDY0337046.1 GNAT family N-acetyltransferase [Candidatus Cloacimonadaceae bacterium]MCB5269210.1 GNAT family N-acetyltransferase [Candidatus Cloacimonadota bacterium]MCK9334460.1 GNAT family N-acetyltransferase [Candidatus Cloacimonadota bacterium]MDD2543513.1 GNAT family N-acetyltransferase [Candidatus Cloacimonadota bacterium]
MLQIIQFTNLKDMDKVISKDALIEFLHTHLDRFRDDKLSIGKAIDYAFSRDAGRGGFVLLALQDDQPVGALVMNDTGMQDFIPENILVYIAVDAARRGGGIGKALITKAFELTKGNIALHVEYDNPAKRLYERLGFSSKYAEMRWQRS